MQLSESRLRQIFQEYDSNGKGYLTKRELKLAFIVVFGYKPSSTEARRIIQSASSISNAPEKEDADSVIEGIALADFVGLCSHRQQKEDSSLESRRVFNALDASARGFLTVDDVKSARRRVAAGLGDRLIENVVDEVDRSGHGRIALGDFFDLYNMAQDL